MPVEIIHHDDLILVNLEGQLYAPEAEVFKLKLYQFVNTGIHKVHINMSKLDFIDCTGLGAFVGLHNHLKSRGGRLTLTGLKHHVHELFQITHLINLLDIQEIHVEKF